MKNQTDVQFVIVYQVGENCGHGCQLGPDKETNGFQFVIVYQVGENYRHEYQLGPDKESNGCPVCHCLSGG